MKRVASVEVVPVHYYEVLDTNILMKSYLRESLHIIIRSPYLKWRLKGVTRAIL